VFAYTGTAFFPGCVIGSHAAEPFISPYFGFPVAFLYIRDDGPSQPAQETAGQENLNGR